MVTVTCRHPTQHGPRRHCKAMHITCRASRVNLRSLRFHWILLFSGRKDHAAFCSDVSALNLASRLSLFLPAKLKPFLQDRTQTGLHAPGRRPTALSSHQICYLLRGYLIRSDRSRTDIDWRSRIVCGNIGGPVIDQKP